tara:strand:- start:408 stop:572 length:165 start_codon:yes stop_codon:yes gene_type:complete
MNRFKSIKSIRKKLSSNQESIGSWIQIPNCFVAEIMGQMGFDGGKLKKLCNIKV